MKCQEVQGYGLLFLLATLLQVVSAQVPVLTVKPNPLVENGKKMDMTCVLPDTFGGKFTPKLTISLGTTGPTTKKQNAFYASSTHTADISKLTYLISCSYLGPNNQKVESKPSSITVTMKPTITSTKPCIPADFQGEQPCTLSVTTAYNVGYMVSEYKWQYSVDPTFEATVTIKKGTKGSQTNPLSDTFKLELSKYYAGYYRCWINYKYLKFVGSEKIQHTFRIDGNKVGVTKGASCTKDFECITYNAVCSGSKCECQAPRNITYDSGIHKAVACLALGENPDSSNSLAGSTLVMISMLMAAGLFNHHFA